MQNYFIIEEKDDKYYPVVLFKSISYQNVSIRAKFLYGILYEKMAKSMENNWVDEKGILYILLTGDEICHEMHTSFCEVEKYLRILEEEELVWRENERIYLRKVMAA